MKETPLRLAVLGAGRWGRRCIETARRLENARLARVASRSPEAAALAGPGVAVDADWRAVVSAPDVDAVIVATPPALHAEMAAYAIDRGKAVFIEKPLTLDPAEAIALRDRAERRNALVRVDHIHLHNPAYKLLKARAASLGRVRRLESVGGSWGPFRRDVPPLWDYGAHDAAMCLDVAGAPPEVDLAVVEEDAPQPEGPGRNLKLRWLFPGGLVADVRLGNLMRPKQRRFTALFPETALVFDDAEGAKLFEHEIKEGRIGPGRSIPVSQTPPLQLALSAFCDDIRADKRGLASLGLGVHVVELLANCDRQLRRPA